MKTNDPPTPSASASDGAAAAVLAEVERATAKFPTWPTDPLHALAVLGEEFGELTKEMLQLTYEPHKSRREYVRKEAIQCAAMALRLVMSLDRYEYTPGVQHSQGNPQPAVMPASDTAGAGLPMPFQLRVAGHEQPLTCRSLHAFCGEIRDGVAFEFGNEGGWVVSLDDLTRIVEAARGCREQPSPAGDQGGAGE